jgi:hypothetical protein
MAMLGSAASKTGEGTTIMIRQLAGTISLLGLCALAQAQTSVQVLDYGAEPRQLLRYQFTAGQVEHASMEMSMNTSLEVNGQKMPMPVTPPIRTTLNVHVTDVAADGSARVEFETRSMEADVSKLGGPEAQASAAQYLAAASQMSGWYRTDTRGRELETSVSVPDTPATAGLSQVLNEAMGGGNETTQQFPDEPIGPGARWRVVQQHQIMGQKMIDVQEFTLRSRSGSKVELESTLFQPTTGAAVAAVTAGSAATASPMATGKLSLDLRRIVGAMEVTGDSVVDMPATVAQGQSQPQKSKLTMRMHMSVAPTAD